MPLLVLVALLFFCSGASALIYQVLWLRKLGLVFGVTVYAASTVWASFMFGLAAGSLLSGRIADRVRRPLVWFGAAEALIAVSAVATPAALAALQGIYASLYPSLPHGGAAITAARFLIALAVLIVPTVLMGATLPLVVKSSAFRDSDLGQRMAVLYVSNTAGAIAGTLVSGLYLIPRHGIRASFLVAGSVNLTVAAIAILTGLVRGRGSEHPAHDPSGSDSGVLLSPARRTVLIVFGLSGFASLALEVIWFRVLVLLVRPTVYGFAVMLAVLLSGIGIGSYLVSPLLKRERPWLLILAVIELVLAIVAVLYDFYHVQVMQGDVLKRMEKHLPLIGTCSLRGPPTRLPPHKGELNYPVIFDAIDEMGWSGWVGAEYGPGGPTVDSLVWGSRTGSAENESRERRQFESILIQVQEEFRAPHFDLNFKATPHCGCRIRPQPMHEP